MTYPHEFISLISAFFLGCGAFSESRSLLLGQARAGALLGALVGALLGALVGVLLGESVGALLGALLGARFLLDRRNFLFPALRRLIQDLRLIIKTELVSNIELKLHSLQSGSPHDWHELSTARRHAKNLCLRRRRAFALLLGLLFLRLLDRALCGFRCCRPVTCFGDVLSSFFTCNTRLP